jgi:hypothetical protein
VSSFNADIIFADFVSIRASLFPEFR